ncbi:MAG: Transcriptional regulator, ArsR family, partial [uncultured Thermomicrobiales bacterium]
EGSGDAARTGSGLAGAGRSDAAGDLATAGGGGGARHRDRGTVRDVAQRGLEAYPHPGARPVGAPSARGAGALPVLRPRAARGGRDLDRGAAPLLGGAAGCPRARAERARTIGRNRKGCGRWV